MVTMLSRLRVSWKPVLPGTLARNVQSNDGGSICKIFFAAPSSQSCSWDCKCKGEPRMASCRERESSGVCVLIGQELVEAASCQDPSTAMMQLSNLGLCCGRLSRGQEEGVRPVLSFLELSRPPAQQGASDGSCLGSSDMQAQGRDLLPGLGCSRAQPRRTALLPCPHELEAHAGSGLARYPM